MTATEFKRIPKEQLEEMPSMQEESTIQILRSKEELYKDIIRQVVNREPANDDYKEVEIAKHPDYPTQELIAFKGNPLGRILFSWECGWEGSRIVFTFEPIPTFKQDATI